MVWDGTSTPQPVTIKVTANVGPTSTTTELVLASSGAITFDGVTDFEIAFSWYNINKTVAGDTFDIYLYDGPTAGSGTQIGHFIFPGAATASTVLGSGFARTVVTPTAGSHTFTARLVRTGGTGTATLSATAVNVGILSIWQVK